MKYLKLSIIILWQIPSSKFLIAQPAVHRLEKSVEVIYQIESLKNAKILGIANGSLSIVRQQHLQKNTYEFLNVDETTGGVTSNTSAPFVPPIRNSNWNDGFLKLLLQRDNFFVFSIGFMNEGNTISYQKLWLQYNSTNFLLDSVPNSDKSIHASFSTDQKYLLLSTLNSLADRYDSITDDHFTIYNLDSIKNGIVNRTLLPCKHCKGGMIVGDHIFFSKSILRDDFDGGFEWTNIYRSPLANCVDTTLISSFSTLLAISPDAKYMLIKRKFDLPNNPIAILHIPSKKYQLLLGRKYSGNPSFYSDILKMFAFRFSDRLVYIKFPRSFPFDALRKDNPLIPRSSEKLFYAQFIHPNFD
jgi:hypothetical protein